LEKKMYILLSSIPRSKAEDSPTFGGRY